MIDFIEDQRQAYGVEPICRMSPIAPSTYHAHVGCRRAPAKLSEKARRDAVLTNEVHRVFKDNYAVYEVRKVAADEAIDPAKTGCAAVVQGRSKRRLKFYSDIANSLQDMAADLNRIEGTNLILRLIRLDDAEYVHALRTDITYNRHISEVRGTPEHQILWIEENSARGRLTRTILRHRP